MELGPATAVTTNTYFGRFHATYWQRWTAAADVEVRARRVRFGAGAAHGVGHEQGVAHRRRRRRSRAPQDVRLVGPIDRFVDGGGMWLEFTTETG